MIVPTGGARRTGPILARRVPGSRVSKSRGRGRDEAFDAVAAGLGIPDDGDEALTIAADASDALDADGRGTAGVGRVDEFGESDGLLGGSGGGRRPDPP